MTGINQLYFYMNYYEQCKRIRYPLVLISNECLMGKNFSIFFTKKLMFAKFSTFDAKLSKNF